MPRSSDYGGMDVFALSDRSLYRWLDQQDDGLRELPEDAEFAKLEMQQKPRKLQRIRNRLRFILKKRGRHAYPSIQAGI